jgi:signal transduction histidine kinase
MAEERATPREAEQLVHRAVAFFQKEGQDRALTAFGDTKGAFTYRDLYIMVLDLRGNLLSNAFAKHLVGTNVLGLRDVDGQLFIKETLDVARTRGKGWIEYRWTNPATQKLERKVTYVERVGNITIACGAYRR